MKNESGLEFRDISTEKYRTYDWLDGSKITITNPIYVCGDKANTLRETLMQALSLSQEAPSFRTGVQFR